MAQRISIPAMTAIFGIFGTARPDASEAVRRSLRAMQAAGSEIVELWQDPGDDAALGAVSDAWQVDGASDERARLAFNESAVVVTDASLYYAADLERALRDAGAPLDRTSRSPAAKILAAYRTWGRAALERLEGDFAMLVWDRRERRVVAARDHSGVRGLFYASYAGGFAVASRLDGIVALPGFDATLDVMSISDDALFLRVQEPERTAYSSIKRLPAGHLLEWRKGDTPKVGRWWEVPYFARGDGPPFSEALEELRRLIIAAVTERTKHPAGSVVWLSGGYDSPTLYAASHAGSEITGQKPARPVSIRYPRDDPGYEDDFIEATTSFWHEKPTWVDVAEIPSIENPLARARLRDEPIYHTYELWNASLARATRELGTRVALIGSGGDQFFSSTTVRLADHFRAGRFITLAREWREAGGGNDWRLFAREVVAPNLPHRVRTVAALLRQGRTLQHRLARQVAPWANRASPHYELLMALNRTPIERRLGESHASVDQSWSLRHVTPTRIAALLTQIGLLDGVEVRTPLFDSRVIRFAAGRPLAESYSRRENKRLLRGAFRGLLPDTVLGPRTSRTGLPVRYLKRTALAYAAWSVGRWSTGMILADLGVIDGRKFLDRVAEVQNQGLSDLEEGVALVATVQTECWLRAREDVTPKP